MSTLPEYATCSAAAAQRHIDATQRGLYKLLPDEEVWRDRYAFLKQRGYDLRPRYHPEWVPSWLGTNRVPRYSEDSIMSRRPHVLDAIRIKDGAIVSMKVVRTKSDEIRIAQFLSSEELLVNPANHCVPVLDTFLDPLDAQMSLMVMPYLRPFNQPGFGTVAEVTDFIHQTLEGLSFLHSQNIAHRDCAAGNIMMDGRPLYPEGHHPVRLNYTPDAVFDAPALSRTERPVQYYFIDFGLSSQFTPGQSPLVLGTKGRDKDPPELSDEIPYNAFQLDICILGNVYYKDFFQKYHDLEFLSPLITAMTHEEPSRRPTAQEAFHMFSGIHSRLQDSSLRWRLRSRAESAPRRIAYDAFAAAKEGIYHLRRLVA